MKRLIGRKLYAKWGDKAYIAIEKIPDGWKKNLEMDLMNDNKEYVSMELCDVYENERGEKIEESIGVPSKRNPGFNILQLFIDSGFWKTANEVLEEQDKTNVTED